MEKHVIIARLAGGSSRKNHVAALLMAIGVMVVVMTPSRRLRAQHDSAHVLSTAAHADADIPEFFDSTMVRGYRDWTPYVTPGMCVQAAMAVDNLIGQGTSWITANDTGTYAADRATVSDSSVRIARACGSRFQTATVSVRDLLDMVRLALLQNNDDDAQAAAARYVASVPEGAQRRQALFTIDTMYLSAKPIRFAAVDSIARVLDGYGLEAAEQRAELYGMLMQEALRRYDVPRMERLAVAGLKVQDQLHSAPDGNLLVNLYIAELYSSPVDAPERVMRILKSAGLKLVNMDSLPLFFKLFGSTVGYPASPLKADFWVGVDSSARVWPVPGKPSILVLGRALEFPARAAMWRRIARKYGSAINITFLYQTEGSFHNGPPLTPAQEAERLGRYYRDELGMPVTVAVRETKYRVIPDGRRVPFPPEKELVDRATRPITDASGKIIFMGFEDTPDGKGEAVITRLIDRALGRDQDAASSAKQSQ